MDLIDKSWVGSIYHKFETICQEVDDFVNKDTTRFVENQVQSVGASVKRLYSDVVQDILPHSGNDIKNNTQLETDKQADMTGHVKAITSITMKPDCINGKQLCVEHGSTDALNICNTSSSGDIDLEICSMKPSSANSSPEVKTDSTLQLAGDNDSANYVEEETAKVTIPVTADSSSKSIVLSMTLNDDNQHNQDQQNTELGMASSPAILVHDAEYLAFKPQGSLWHSFSDETECFSNISRTGLLSVGESPLVQDMNFDDNRNLPELPKASTVKTHQHVTPAMNSSTTLALDLAEGDSREDGMLCGSSLINDGCFMVSDDAQTPELGFSYFSSDNEAAWMDVISSCHSTCSESLNLLASSCASNTQTAENIYNTHVLSNGSGFDISDDACPSLPATGSLEINAIDTVPALSIAESSDFHASTTHGTVFSCSDKGNSNICVGIDDLYLETIDLSTNVKCDVPNDNFVRTTAYGRKNFRYYKKLIQDAFASRKRLSKEYEHLSILYGDFEMDSKKHFEPSSLPSSLASLHATRSLSSHQNSDSGWELL